MALIKYAPPVEGKREPMCKTDEATVSRIRAPFSPYDGMVERVQAVKNPSADMSQTFYIYYDHNGIRTKAGIEQSLLHYHLYKFLALRIGTMLFPDNFVRTEELRVFRRRGMIHTAMYSDFVGDETHVIERRKTNMRHYYRFIRKVREEKDGDEANEAIDQFKATVDEAERRLNPALDGLEKTIAEVGMSLSHPSMNYHVSDGRTVFFEVSGIDVLSIANATLAMGAGAKHAIEAASAIYASYLSLIANKLKLSSGHGKLCESRYREAAYTPLADIYQIVFNILANKEALPHVPKQTFHKIREELVDSPYSFIIRGVSSWRFASETIVESAGKSGCLLEPTPLSDLVDFSVIELIERENWRLAKLWSPERPKVQV